MVSFPPCKINLGLHVIDKRADGYHNIETCFYPVQWTDALEVLPAADFSFSASGLPIPGPVSDNLCVRAYTLLKQNFDLPPVAIHLHKVVPMGAGLGGGSSDGAYTLICLNEIFELGLTYESLKTYAAELGSDCAFFLAARPAIGTGRGELLSEVALTLQRKYVVIVKPALQVSTAAAYAGVKPRRPASSLREIIESQPVKEWRHVLINDFEAHLFKQFPVIENVRTQLYALGALYASMSGSGSAVFGIFDEAVDLKDEFKNVTYWSGHLD